MYGLFWTVCIYILRTSCASYSRHSSYILFESSHGPSSVSLPLISDSRCAFAPVDFRNTKCPECRSQSERDGVSPREVRSHTHIYAQTERPQRDEDTIHSVKQNKRTGWNKLEERWREGQMGKKTCGLEDLLKNEGL